MLPGTYVSNEEIFQVIKQCCYNFSSQIQVFKSAYNTILAVLYTREDSLWAIKQDRLENEICPSHTFHNSTSSLPSNPVSQKSKFKSFHEELNLKITTDWQISYLGSTILYNIKLMLSNRGMLVVSHAAFPEGNFLPKEEFFFYHYATQSELQCKCTYNGTEWHLWSSAAHTPEPAPLSPSLSSAEHSPSSNPAPERAVSVVLRHLWVITCVADEHHGLTPYKYSMAIPQSHSSLPRKQSNIPRRLQPFWTVSQLWAGILQL